MSAYPPPQYPQYPPPANPYPQPQTSSKAIVALVLAILAWTTCPVFLAIPAVIFAGQAKREIESSNGWVTGEGFVTASRVMGWLNIALVGAFVLFFVVLMIIGIVFGETTTTSNISPDTIPEF